MSNIKHLSDIVKVCSVLPALIVMPAVADLPNTSGNAWVFGDLNLGYDVANNSAIGGRVSVINDKRGNDFPEYNVVGRSVNIKGAAGKKPSLYVGPVNLTLRELGENEEFVYNWQVAGTAGESNWADAELQEGEVSYKDIDIAKQAGLVWNDSVETVIEKTGFDVSQDSNYLKMATGLSLFANRDNTAVAGNFSADYVNLTLDGTNVVANNVLMNSSNLNVVNANVPKNILNGLHNASDGYTVIKAENFVVQNGSRIEVKDGATLDLSQSDNVLFSGNDTERKDMLYNYGTVKLGGDVRFENAIVYNYSYTEEQKKIVYDGEGDITFVNSKISNPGVDYNGIVIGGLVDFKTTGDICFTGDRVDAGASGAFVNSTKLSDMILQADKISVSGGRAGGYAGAIFNTGNMSFLAQENLFTDNHQTAVAPESKYYKLGGGALYNRGTEYAAQMTIGFADGSSKNTFASNTALQNGGAIESRTDDPNSSAVVDIIGTTLFSKNEAGVNGGAIMNWTDADATSSTTVNLVGNAAFAENIAGANGGAIFNGGLNATVDMSEAIASFSGNKATVDGGAIYNDANAVLKIGDAKFVNNRASYDSWESKGYGGAIFANGDLDIVSEKVNGVMFKDNVAFSGGAVYGSMNSTIGMNLENVLFVGNHAIADAGALGIFNNDVSKLTNVVFRNNTVAVAVDGLIAEDDIKEADGGGAIQLGGTASADLVKTHFVGNESGVRGGAISARHGAGYELNITDSSFTNNKSATNGGSIANVFAGAVSIENVNFIGNKANERGGAIYNGQDWNFGSGDGGAMSSGDGIVNISGTNVFSGNIAGDLGGAIYNGGLNATVDMSEAIASFSGNKATVDGGAIYNDANAVLKIGDAKFVNNRASYDSWESKGYGGAIFANGDLDIVSEKVNGVMFKDNVAFSGGAVYGSMNSKIGMNLENVLFVGNHAIADAGALGIFNNDVSKLTNVVFRNNTVAVAVDGLIAEDDIKEADGGGAIQLGGTASADLVKTHFVGNESGVRGGAISARHGAGYELNITDSSFTNNKSATNGGSIANVFAGAVSIENVNFIGNKANERGGAIYNGQDWNFGSTDGGAMSSGDGIVNISGTNVFSGNIAGDLGGAIFNGADGVINMTGINTFVNNTANGGANDIYNDGTLNIAADTKVVISGGIKGNGTLTLAGDATLDIGTSLVEQDKISIDGTVVASIVSGRSYGRLSSDNLAFGEDAVLQLNIGSVGTYDIFGDGKKYDVDILVGDTYIATETDRGIVIETKSVADIAEDAGLTVETAGTVANLANSVDRNLQKLSLLAQQALNSGNSALVEKETAKLAPEDENMTRSVAMSAQSQALSLASGRMVGGMGRAGGDKSQTNGFWAQGLFNKTEYADQFHGYSRGVAVGADTTIDRKYTIGAGLMHTNSDVHSGSRHTDISTTTLFAYGQYKPTDWFLNGTLVYAMSEYDESADPFGVQINSLYNTNSFGAQAMTGYALKYGLTPQVGIRYLHIEQDEYNNGVNRMNAMDYEYLSGVAGFAYSFNINNARSALQLKPELRAMLTYDLVQDNSVATVVMNNINSSYIVDGENLSRVGGEFGVGLTATYNGVDVSVMYDITLHEDYTSQTGMIKFRGRF